MPITWRGSAVTPLITTQLRTDESKVVFAIVNTFRSRCNVIVLRMVCQLDATEAAIGNGRVMPMMRARRCASADVVGGIALTGRAAWDTTLNTPDTGVEVLYDPGMHGGVETAITATGSGHQVWQQFTARQLTGAEQQLSWDNFVVPAFAATGAGYLAPGEALIVQQTASLPTGGTAWFQIAWEEDQIDAGYVLAGTVNLNGEPVSGAKVLLVTDSSTGLPTPTLETITTGAPGTFSKTLASGVKAAVFVQHEAGGTKYTDEGKPFIEKP
jgi:hypothetical protein